MKQISMSWLWAIKCLVYLVLAAVIFAGLLSVVITKAAAPDHSQLAWSAPSAISVRRASAIPSVQSAPTYLDNTDCTLLDYRFVANDTMRSGCFSDSAFGLVDTGNKIVIFNGTDEGLRLLPYGAHDILVPWPGSTVLLALSALSTGGSIVTLYKNPVPSMQDQRDLLGRLVGKQLIAPPELPLSDPSGQRLVINPQSMAFSDGGSWLVAETIHGSFVRINLSSLQVTAFARSYVTLGSPGTLPSHLAVTGDGRFIAIANDIALEYKVYDLATCDGVINNLQPQQCRSYDYRPLVGQQINSLRYIRHIRFINNGLLSFEARTTNPASEGIYLLAPTDSISFLTEYIGVGDSYTAGEGAFDYLSGTDEEANMCHLSRNSYPLLITQAIFSSTGGHSVACSGAVTNDIASTSDTYRGQVRGVTTWRELRETQSQFLEAILANFRPGYVAQHRFIQRWQPRVITVSIGGNDIGFGNILQSCVIPRVSRHTGANTCFSTYEDRLEVFQLIDRTMPRWTALFRQLQREAPGSRIYAIGYPQIALDSGDCARNVNLSQGELQFATSLIDYLNNDIEQAALAANITYVDISQALVGYRLCEAASHAVAMNGLTAGKDGGPLGTKIFGKESYHPNALGQSLIAQAILRATNNLSASSLPPSTNPPHPALNVPNSGRTLQTRLPATDLTAAVIKSDVSVVLQANGAEHGLKPLSTYAIRLDGSTGQVIAATASNESGDLDTTIVIPSTVAPGGHTIDVIGTNLAGIAVNLTQPVYIQASDSDTDGDTIPDNLDTCPGAAQTNTDTDRDGIDDVCDVLISAPSAPPTVPAAVSSVPANTAPTAPAAPHSTPYEPPAPIIGIPSSDSAVVIQNQSGRTLGVTTSNPQATGHASQPAKAATSAKQRPAQISTSMPALAPKINWKPWVFIPMTLWWTSITVIYLCWIASRRKQAQYL